jgi:hypothetical protein
MGGGWRCERVEARTVIRGQKIGLRAVEFDDLPQLLEWRNKPEFRQFFRENRELTWEQQLAWFSEKVIKAEDTRMFSVVSLDDGNLLGAAGLCYIDWVNGSADLSIYIGHEGKYIDDNLAPDALKVLIRHAFEELRFHRLWTEVYSFDEKKQKLFRDLGFSVDGEHRHTKWLKAKWYDSTIFSLLG